MAHPQASARSLEFFLDLSNVAGSVRGGTVVLPPNNEEYWESKGAGIYYGWEFVIYNASQTQVDEVAAPAGSVYWDSVVLGLEDGPTPLEGYKVSMRGYRDEITETPVYETNPDTGEQILVDIIYNNVRTYPAVTGVETVFSNEQTRMMSQYPRPERDPNDWSTVITPRRFEGVALYGSIRETCGQTDPIVVGIADGSPRCRGFVANKGAFVPDDIDERDYFLDVETNTGWVRTTHGEMQPLLNTASGVALEGNIMPFQPGGQIQGLIEHPEQLPKVADIGNTYVQYSEEQPFPGFLGTQAWVYTGIEYADENGNRMRDSRGNEIEDFFWDVTTDPNIPSGYIYALVFDEALFEYIQRRGGPYTDEIFIKDPAVLGGWFPQEPYVPENDPPIYPMDTIPAFVPDEREYIDVHYNVSISGNIAGGGAISESLDINQTCIAPTRNWQKLLKSLLEKTYYYNGISRSYATKRGYCDPDSPNFGENPTDPYCLATDAVSTTVSTPAPTVTKPSPTPIAPPPN